MQSGVAHLCLCPSVCLRCRLRGESIPAKYTEREPGWHETIDADVQEMLTGGQRCLPCFEFACLG